MAFLSLLSLITAAFRLFAISLSPMRSLQGHMISLNDHDPVAIASLGHFVEFAKLHAFDAAALIAMILELRVPKITATPSLQTATE